MPPQSLVSKLKRSNKVDRAGADQSTRLARVPSRSGPTQHPAVAQCLDETPACWRAIVDQNLKVFAIHCTRKQVLQSSFPEKK